MLSAFELVSFVLGVLLIAGACFFVAFKLQAESGITTTRDGARFGIEMLADWSKWMAGIETATIAGLSFLTFVSQDKHPRKMIALAKFLDINAFVSLGIALFCVAWILSSLSSLAIRIYSPNELPDGRYDIHEQPLFARGGPKLTVVVTAHHFLWALGLASFAGFIVTIVLTSP